MQNGLEIKMTGTFLSYSGTSDKNHPGKPTKACTTQHWAQMDGEKGTRFGKTVMKAHTGHF